MRTLALGLFCLLCCDAARVEGRDRRRPKPSALRGRNDSATVSDNSVESPCKGKPLDFVFIIDSSRSVHPHDYEKVKVFIADIVRFLDVGADATRVGLLQYGSVVQNHFSLGTYSSNAQVEAAVRGMEHLASGTMTGLAIQYAMETAFSEAEGARPADLHIPRIAMVVTDGRPQDTVEEVAAEARQAGIQIFAIGVGRVDMSTLRAISSEPHSEHVHLVANFSQVETLISVFQSKLCGDTDTCSVVDHQCEHICVSTPVAYMCRCRKGYTLNPDRKTCKAEDMCAVVDHGCAHICANLPEARYECRCQPGYDLNQDLKTCRKIDQCALGTHGCEHECVNTEDSFQCKCRKGYTLQPDGKTCKKIDQCSLGTHGCEHECVNTEDSFQCKCRKGFTLRPDLKTCKSLDLCQTVDHGCEHLCVSTPDSYTCECFQGFTLEDNGKTCKKQTECGDRVMDLVFVIDGSKSLGPSNFQLVKQFVNGIVDSLEVSGAGTHVGLLQYSTKVQSEFTLGQYTTGQDVNEAVSRMQYLGRGSMTGSALRHMFEHSFSAKEGARPDVPHVCVVFTDGRSQDDVAKWSAKAKESGITMYALGVGKALEEELREIASEPDEKHLYYAEDFSRMEEITDKLKSSLCKDSPPRVNVCECANGLAFQNQVTQQLNKLTHNIEVVSKRLERLEHKLGHR